MKHITLLIATLVYSGFLYNYISSTIPCSKKLSKKTVLTLFWTLMTLYLLFFARRYIPRKLSNILYLAIIGVNIGLFIHILDTQSQCVLNRKHRIFGNIALGIIGLNILYFAGSIILSLQIDHLDLESKIYNMVKSGRINELDEMESDSLKMYISEDPSKWLQVR